MFAILLLAAVVVSPNPSPPPLRTISNVHVREVCTALREKIRPSLAGMFADDDLSGQGQQLLNRLSLDAEQDYIGDMGGAGARVAMDNMRVETIANGMAANIQSIQKLLDGAVYRGTNDPDRVALAAVTAQLQQILAQQKTELNILSFVAYSNNGRYLQGKLDPIGGNGAPPSTYQREAAPLTLPQLLALQRKAVHDAEAQASGAMAPLIAACR
jgi:hypothetical protein